MHPSEKPLEFLPRIESLRGIAALTVIAYHVNGQLSALPAYGWLDGFASKLIGAISNGTGAVVTFFVLSGFVLARSLDTDSAPVRFFRNRLLRLFPAAIAVVALLTLLHRYFGLFLGYEASFDPLSVILNMLMIRSDINGVMWSMTVECAAAPLVLLSVWIWQAHGERLLWLLIVVLLALSSWGPYVHLLGGFTNLAPLYAFVVGVLIHFRGGVAPLIVGWPITAAIVAIAVFCFCGTRTQSALVLMLECISAATVIGLIAYRPAMTLFRPLDFELVRFYGRISYSLYLLHPLGILFAFRVINPTALHAWGLPLFVTISLTTLAAILLTTPAAYLIWRFIEKPGIAWARILSKQPTLLPVRTPAP